MRNNIRKLLLISTCVLITCCVTANVKPSQFRVIMEWKIINFTWPNAETYRNALINKTYIPKNCLIAGVNYYRNHFYLTLPRMKTGIPATLTRIPSNESTSPILTPYPSWSMNMLNNCTALQNTQNLEIDSKGRMWILDGGRTTTLSMRHNVNDCPPKLIVYDIDKDVIIRTYEFPKGVVDINKNYIYDIVIDENDGDDYGYITDNSIKDPGLIVYSYKENRAWKIRHRTMLADMKAAEFRVNTVVVSTPINIAGIALGPKIYSDNTSLTISEDRDVYYCPLSGYNLYSISAAILKNESLGNNSKLLEESIKNVGVKASQTDGMIVDNQGILYYSLLGSSSISMWDTRLPFASAQKIIARDTKYLSWPNSFTFDDSGNMIVLSNNLQKYVFDTLDLNDVNFRLLMSHTGTRSYIYNDDNLKYHHVTATTSRSAIQSSTTRVIKEEEDEEGVNREETATNDGNNLMVSSSSPASLITSTNTISLNDEETMQTRNSTEKDESDVTKDITLMTTMEYIDKNETNTSEYKSGTDCSRLTFKLIVSGLLLSIIISVM